MNLAGQASLAFDTFPAIKEVCLLRTMKKLNFQQEQPRLCGMGGLSTCHSHTGTAEKPCRCLEAKYLNTFKLLPLPNHFKDDRRRGVGMMLFIPSRLSYKWGKRISSRW
jgi:hypothetical protein